MVLRFIFSLSILLNITVFSTAQINIDNLWGNVPTADLKMTVYKPDTSADAVVLIDNGFLTEKIDFNEWKCSLKAFHRVKIFRKSAFEDYGKHSIWIGANENLVNLRAQTINPDGTKTPVTEFFDEKVTANAKRKKFAFSKLQEGSIVEYEYTIEKTNLFSMYPWTFQERIPVRHSELIMDIPPKFEYVYLYNSYLELKRDSIIEKDPKKTFKTTYYRFTLDTVEAMKPEGYVTTMYDYLSYLRFQLAAKNYDDGSPPKRILQDWEVLAEELLEDHDLGFQLRYKPQYNDIWAAVSPLLLGVQNNEEKMRIIYDYIAQNVAWIDDYYSIAVQEKTLDDAYKKRKANSGELNMMLIACLKEAGIKAKPLLISTRDNGKAFKEYPFAGQFNHLLCYIDNDDKPLFLDVGSPVRPMNLPRVASLNGYGWILDKKNPRWVDIPAPLSTESMLADLFLSQDGTLKGKINTTYTGYAAVDERTEVSNDEKNTALKKAWAKVLPDVQLDSIVNINQNNLKLPFKRTMNCTIPNAAIIANDLMYFKPTFRTNYEENPFKQEKRNYPVDFPYPIRDNFVLNVTIPEGYIVEEMPKELTIALPKGGGKFIYSCTKTENKIQLTVRIDIKQLQFLPSEYGNIKSFFNQIVNKKSEQIVLKKK
jgi:hypothetical protein